MRTMSVRSAGGVVAFGLALAPAGAFAQQVAASSTPGNAVLQEIIVTAQKREERLQDVPVPVTAVTSDALLDRNQLRAEEFFASVPGLNLQFQNNRSNLAIRGITTGPATGNPVVGYTVDDVPYGSSAGIAGLFGSAPDLDPSELARIEVLRGPQGTLYGASSIGGLVKYVTLDPDTVRLSGAVAAGTHTIRGVGNDVGYNVRGAINLPLGDTLAVRASAFTREDPGYIDNVVTGERGVNKAEVKGARLAALWRPSDVLSVKLGALYQQRKLFGSPNVDVRLGRDLQNDQFGTGRSDWEHQVYSAIVTAKLGRSELTSLSSYSYSPSVDTVDFSASLLTGILPVLYPESGVDPMATVLRQPYSTRKVAQEVRLATPIGENLDWLVGAFYTRERTKYTIETFATDPANGTIYGLPILWRDSLNFTEYAAFTDLTARFSDRFDVQLGARWSENRQELHHRQWTFFDANGFLFTDPKSSGHAVTYLFTPRFKISPDHMAYARIATGYRPGGPNAVCAGPDEGIEIPCQYRPDETTNYEVGAKGDIFDRMLSYDVSVYHIDWKDIQVTQVVPSGTFNYNSNASRARSRGVELAFQSTPLDGLTLALWGAWTDAELREGFSALSAVYGATGDRLPYSSRFSGRFSVDQQLLVTNTLTAFVGASVTYVGDRKGEFVPTPQESPLRQTYPAYAQADLHAGVKSQDWRVGVFAQNITDKRGIIGGGYNNQTTFNPFWFNYVQPRTIGVSVERTF